MIDILRICAAVGCLALLWISLGQQVEILCIKQMLGLNPWDSLDDVIRELGDVLEKPEQEPKNTPNLEDKR